MSARDSDRAPGTGTGPAAGRPRRGAAKAATAAAATAYVAPAARAVRVAAAQRAGSPPPNGGGGRPVVVLDSLGAAGTGTTFRFFGASCHGLSIPGPPFPGFPSIAGPRFALGAPTTITEIGAYLRTDCTPDLCPRAPITVAVHGAHPDGGPGEFIAGAALTQHPDPDFHYEAAALNVALGPGQYFALFRPRPGVPGCLLSAAVQPFAFAPAAGPMAFVTDMLPVPVHPAPRAVRILGVEH